MKNKVLGAVATVAVGGVAVAATVSATGAGADDPAPVRVLQAPSATLPEAVQRALSRPTSVTAEFGIDPADARRAELPSGKTVWVTPGTKGTCIWDGDSSGSCATAEELAAGKLVLVTTPPVDRDPTRQKAPRFKSGRLTVVGYAPGVADASVVDGAGATRAHQETSNGFYEVGVDDWKPGAGWQLQLGRGAEASKQRPTTLPL